MQLDKEQIGPRSVRTRPDVCLCRQAQNSARIEIWPVRAPPKSEPMLLLTMPTSEELRSVYGSPRLVWLRTLVNVPSALSRTRSVRVKVLLRPADRLTSPGPSITPLGELPKRPMGSGCGPDP